MPAFRARSVSEDTVRIHPSPAPRAAGPSHLDSAVLREDDPATLMSQLMASQQALHASDRESGSMPPAPQQSMPAAGLMANLSEPGVLAFPLQKGAPFSPYCCGLQSNVSVVVKSVFPDLQQPEQQKQQAYTCLGHHSTVLHLLCRRQHPQHHGQQHELGHAGWAQQVHHQRHDRIRPEHHHWLQ